VKEEKDLAIKSVVVSNSVEVLFEHLKAYLFSEEGDPVFSERLLITPSGGMQQWIQIQLASSLDINIACGLTLAFLDKGMQYVRQALYAPTSHRLPSHLELLLTIESVINGACLSSNALWAPLVRYVDGKESRKIALTHYMLKLFKRYGMCAQGASLDWEQRPSHWQEAVWAKVFMKWDYPQRAFQGLQAKPLPSSRFSVHLFAFSYIPPLYFHFLKDAAKYVPVYFYQLSPCQEFWSDLSFDAPSLLGPLGKMGRSTARLLEENDIQSVEKYILFGGQSQLKQIQREMLTLAQPIQNRQAQISHTFSEQDDSIQIHCFSTRHMEIAKLCELISNWLVSKEMQPSDIWVLAPNIAEYAPYIQAIFHSLPYQIADMPSQQGERAIKGLFLILELEKKRWSTSAVFELFEHPLFCQKWGLHAEELNCLKLWVEQTGIRWGFDGGHKAELLKERGCEEIELDAAATWMEGLGYLIEELALPTVRARIEFSQAETLGQIVELLTSLYKDTRELKQEKTLQEWVNFFARLYRHYFIETEESVPLWSLLECLGKGSLLYPNVLYRYAFIHLLMQESINLESVTLNRHELQAIRFGSLLPMRAIPAKVICLIGMQQEAFPHKDSLQALDCLGQHPQCGDFPTHLDFDRCLFLETLLSARDKLLISYIGRDPLDLIEKPPSSVVAHLLPLVSKNQIFYHPLQMIEGVRIVSPYPLNIHLDNPLPLPTKNQTVTIFELNRFCRSYLHHYLASQGFKISECRVLQDEEAFVLTPQRKAALCKAALTHPLEEVVSCAQKEGDFPCGPFGELAKLQLQKEIAFFGEQKTHQLILEPFDLKISAELTVTFTGMLDNVFDQGMCTQRKKEFKTAVKVWPLFLLLNAYDSSKTKILFAASQHTQDRFFEDPIPHLKNVMEFYFYAQNHPILLAVEWIEPILKRDSKKLIQLEHYDQTLKWYLRGKGKIDPCQWIDAYYPLVERVYGEMAHAWF
jgi:exodeoxyribonuclease V gamma subunit